MESFSDFSSEFLDFMRQGLEVKIKRKLKEEKNPPVSITYTRITKSQKWEKSVSSTGYVRGNVTASLFISKISVFEIRV